MNHKKSSTQTTISNVIFFIGGGADKTRERFGIVHWGPTRLMEHAKNLFESEQGPCSLTEYYGYLDKKKILKRIHKLKAKYPDIRINLVGHSRGGGTAMEMATKKLRKDGVNVNLLITLDPVKPRIRRQYKIPTKKGLKNVTRFVNMYAKPKRREPADYIALIGGQYGERLQKRVHHFVVANVGHGQPIPILKTSIDENGTSAFDLLLAESFSE